MGSSNVGRHRVLAFVNTSPVAISMDEDEVLSVAQRTIIKMPRIFVPEIGTLGVISICSANRLKFTKL